MALVTDNFTIYRGDTYRETWTIMNGANPSTIVGGKLYFTIKTNLTDVDGSAVLQLTSPSSGIVLNDAANGKATLTITSAQTAAIAVGTYWYDVQLKNSDNEITTLVRGRLTVDADVTISTA